MALNRRRSLTKSSIINTVYCTSSNESSIVEMLLSAIFCKSEDCCLLCSTGNQRNLKNSLDVTASGGFNECSSNIILTLRSRPTICTLITIDLLYHYIKNYSIATVSPLLRRTMYDCQFKYYLFIYFLNHLAF